MAAEGLRRSTRVRTQVKTYAEEQAKEIAKSKRKTASVDSDDEDNSEVEVKPAKQTKRTAKSIEDDDAETESKPKKKAKASSSKAVRSTSNRGWHGDAAERRITVANRNIKRLAPGQEERRLRKFVEDAPPSYHAALKKANKDRMFILDRERGLEEDCHANHNDCPCETIQIAGSTGNVYTVTISHLPSCTCPVGIFQNKGKEQLCKHALYILHNMLKAPEHLKQQNAFLTSELKEIFAKAPALPGQVAENEPMDGNRKPLDDDCPICFMEFDGSEETVWCRAACGNNIHKACFDQWARTKGYNVTCPFCRTRWEYKEAPKIKPQTVNVTEVKMPESKSASGYRNVRDQLNYDN